MYEYKATIVRVVDGDTVDIDISLGFQVSTRQRVRLNGINAPEMNTPEGKASKAYLSDLLSVGAVVMVDSVKPGGGDKYGRYLAFIDNGGVSINTKMVSDGFAKPWDGQGTKP